MWAYGHYLHTKNVNVRNITQGYGVEVEFDQSSQSSNLDKKLVRGMLGYIRKIQETIEVEFSSFQCVIFMCKRWDTFDWNNVKEDRDSRLICINSRKMWDELRSLMFSPNTATMCFFTQMCWIGIGDSY